MAVIYENVGDGIVRAYSNAGFMIHGGIPEGDYAVVYDPEEANRTYVETNIPIEGATVQQPAQEPQFRSFSKIKLKIAIARNGLLQVFETMLQNMEVAPGYTALDAWNDAQIIRDDFDGFDDMLASIKSNLDVSDEEVDQILSYAKTE